MKERNRKVYGQGTIEWILIIFVLVGFVMLFGKSLKSGIVTLVNSVFHKIGDATETLSADK